jgi:hypothetical protein
LKKKFSASKTEYDKKVDNFYNNPTLDRLDICDATLSKRAFVLRSALFFEVIDIRNDSSTGANEVLDRFFILEEDDLPDYLLHQFVVPSDRIVIHPSDDDQHSSDRTTSSKMTSDMSNSIHEKSNTLSLPHFFAPAPVGRPRSRSKLKRTMKESHSQYFDSVTYPEHKSYSLPNMRKAKSVAALSTLDSDTPASIVNQAIVQNSKEIWSSNNGFLVPVASDRKLSMDVITKEINALSV